MLFCEMLSWVLFVAQEGSKAQSIDLFFKLLKKNFTKVAEIKLNCSYDYTPSNSHIEV